MMLGFDKEFVCLQIMRGVDLDPPGPPTPEAIVSPTEYREFFEEVLLCLQAEWAGELRRRRDSWPAQLLAATLLPPMPFGCFVGLHFERQLSDQVARPAFVDVVASDRRARADALDYQELSRDSLPDRGSVDVVANDRRAGADALDYQELSRNSLPDMFSHTSLCIRGLYGRREDHMEHGERGVIWNRRFVDVVPPEFRQISEHWKTIVAEYDAAVTARPDLKIAWGGEDHTGWTMFGLRAFKENLPANQLLCPKTWELMQDLERKCSPRKLTTVGFSTLAPGAVILPHADMAGRTPPIRGVQFSISCVYSCRSIRA